MKRLTNAALIFALLIAAVCGISYFRASGYSSRAGSYMVSLNEIEKLCEQGDTAAAGAAAGAAGAAAGAGAAATAVVLMRLALPFSTSTS